MEILINNHDLREFLIKSWMTHDSFWFYHCLQEFGIEKTNKINRAAVKSMSKIEIKRIKKLFGIEKIETFEELKNIMNIAMELFKADFMEFRYTFPERNEIHCEMGKCWAYEGIKRLNVIENYQCAIYTRVEGWFEALNIDYSVSPPLDGCFMHEKGSCIRDYTFHFKE